MKTVVVGMSGGVDSSVAALLLKQQGYRVIGLFMKNWEENDAQGVCQASKEYEDVVRVCDQLEIPAYSTNFVKEYWERVFSRFLEELKLGFTPNPDVLCNREIKFKALLDKALELGADYLATGHYSRVGQCDGEYQLLKGSDPGKDQSYFLYTLRSSILSKVLFPIGNLLKSDLRQIARTHGLATSEKKDSTGICFIGKRDFKKFLRRYIGYSPGPFKNLQGEEIGQHDGVAYYTLGQRKGLGIGGEGEAWYVIAKDRAKNIVYIERGEHPELYSSELWCSDLSWVGEVPALPFTCRAKVRYRQADQACIIQKIEGSCAFVTFEEPQRAVTPRQSIVFYHGDICLGGGMIEENK